MAGCDCAKTSERKFTRSDPGPPLRVISGGGVRIESECVEVELPQPPDDSLPYKPHGPSDKVRVSKSESSMVEAVVAHMGGFELALGKGRKRVPQKICLNTITVTLLNGTTAGWRISEVQTGLDTFAANIAVGKTETFSTLCSRCEDGTASVKVVDAGGNLQATLGGFAICRAIP